MFLNSGTGKFRKSSLQKTRIPNLFKKNYQLFSIEAMEQDL